MVIVDEYLSAMLRDVGKVFGSICSLVEVILGLSYFCGATLVGWFVVAGTALLDFCKGVGDVACILGNELIDFAGSLLRCALLFWHGIEIIIDSFIHIAGDLKWSICHAFNTTKDFLIFLGNELWNFIDQKLTYVPAHIVESFAYVGNTSIFIFQVMWSILVDFLYHVVMTPLLFLQFAAKLLLHILWLPVSFYQSVSSEVLLGFCVLSFSVYMTCKLRLGIPYKIVQLIVFLVRGCILSVCSFVKSLVTILGNVLYVLSPSRQRSDGDDKEYNALCVICREVVVSFIAKPCKHVCLCKTCVYRLRDYGDSKCPMCRVQVTQFEQVFIPS